MFAGNYAPRGWAFCNGQELRTDAFPDLHAAIGTTWGGDGSATFALPDLRGRVPVHAGREFAFGQLGGSELTGLAAEHLPGHQHTAGSAGGAMAVSTGSAVGVAVDARPVVGTLAEGYAFSAGADNMHDNVQPFLSLHFIIALGGDIEPVSMTGSITGEVRMFAGRGVPKGWRRCDGQVLEISENQSLFSVIGTTYGGDGISGFALPDLRERVALHAGQGDGLSLRRLGESGGSAGVELTESQLPYHSHQLVQSAGSRAVVVGQTGGNGNLGGSEPHNNLQPYLVVNYLIATKGSEAV